MYIQQEWDTAKEKHVWCFQFKRDRCEPRHEKTCFSNMRTKGADQPAHPHSLISTFFVCCLDSIIPLVSISEISRVYLASVTAQTGLSLPWSQTPKISFLVMRLMSNCLMFHSFIVNMYTSLILLMTFHSPLPLSLPAAGQHEHTATSILFFIRKPLTYILNLIQNKNCLCVSFENNDADQPAHLHSLNSAFYWLLR